jgi:hypothetical protein
LLLQQFTVYFPCQVWVGDYCLNTGFAMSVTYIIKYTQNPFPY